MECSRNRPAAANATSPNWCTHAPWSVHIQVSGERIAIVQRRRFRDGSRRLRVRWRTRRLVDESPDLEVNTLPNWNQSSWHDVVVQPRARPPAAAQQRWRSIAGASVGGRCGHRGTKSCRSSGDGKCAPGLDGVSSGVDRSTGSVCCSSC
jgi:hypothetical protein